MKAERFRLVPWNHVLSYSWETETGQFHVLRVRSKGLWGTTFPFRLRVPPVQRATVNSILEQ